MQDITMIDTIERYMRGEMLPEERVFFEQLRKTNPAVDHMVVEHTNFLNQMSKYGDRRNLHATLQETHNRLFEAGALKSSAPGKVVRLWKKYKKVVAVAAVIAGVTALGTSSLTSYYAPKHDTTIQQLYREVSQLKRNQNSLNDKINEAHTKGPAEEIAKIGGTGFLIDPHGYLVTSAHVVNHASAVVVQNNKGQQYNAKILYVNPASDLAFLMVVDSEFKSPGTLPYAISRNSLDLGEPIYTLGYPRDEIVYGEGYMSAATGFNGDTLACQIAVAANPGNSGGPVLDRNGEVIGILSNRQVSAQGVVFAIRAKFIYKAISDMASDSLMARIKLPQTSLLKNLDRSQQIKKVQDCIFEVKSY